MPSRSLKQNTLDNAAKIRTYHAQLSACRASFALRSSARYLHPRFFQLNLKLMNSISCTPLKKFVARSIQTGVQPEYSEEGVRVVKIGTMKNGGFNWNDAQFVDEEFYIANARRAGIRRGDILISSTGTGSLGKVDLWDSSERALATVDVNIARIDQKRTSPELLVHLLRHRVVQWQIERELAGSTNQIHIYGEQLGRLQVPIFSLKVYNRLLSRIRIIQKDIVSTRGQLRKQEEIINQILCAEFRYPLKEHREIQRTQHFTTSLRMMAAGFTLRCSTRFHHPDFGLTERFFARQHHERLKAFVSIPIRLGATASNVDFVQEGGAYYVHPGATRKQEVVALQDCLLVTDDFYAATQRRFGLRRNDIVLNRAGEGTIGKSGLWDSDEPAVASDFTMRIRFNDRINPRFAWFYFQSVMFQAQIEREKRGMGNMTNVFPPEVERMLVVACERSRQDGLARDINAELQSRAKTLAMVESKLAEINTIIDEAIGLRCA
jgi:hypothetical protein